MKTTKLHAKEDSTKNRLEEIKRLNEYLKH